MFQLPLETMTSAVQAEQPRVKRKGAFCPSLSHKSGPKSVKCEKMRDSIIHMDHSGFTPDCFINSNQRHHFNGFFYPQNYDHGEFVLAIGFEKAFDSLQ